VIRYAAFLRAVNVGGRTVRMSELAQRVTALGYANVTTFIASGNVLLDAPGRNPDTIARHLERELLKWLGFPVATMVRPFSHLETMVRANPFKGVRRQRDSRLYVTFLWEEPLVMPRLPIVSPREGLKLFRVIEREAYSISVRVEGGKFGVPNFEKALGVPATTRNWNTILRMTKLNAKA
jgi:uncharacterized protein (DUF1697 family)